MLSDRVQNSLQRLYSQVLILVLLDYALRLSPGLIIPHQVLLVLILVLLDYALRHMVAQAIGVAKLKVLILVLLDYALRL